MKALVYGFTVPKYLAAKSLGRFSSQFYYGKPSALKLKEVVSPALPNEYWVKIKPLYAGLCGSDMGAIFYKTSPAVTPYNSFPSVMGHEVVGLVTEVGQKVKGIKIGERITIDPYITCEVRGKKDLCPACQAGHHSLCYASSGGGKFGPGMILGFSKDLPGGFCEEMVVHQSMVIKIPETISNRVAVLNEPLSVGLHAVLRRLPQAGDHVLVIGGGMISYAVIAAIRLLGIDCEITQLSLLDYQKEMGLKMGVDHAITGRDGLNSALLNLPSTSMHRPAIGRQVFKGGFDQVYDCIGSQMSLDDALRSTRARGHITLVGCAGEIDKLDWTFVWSNELTVEGTHAYSKQEHYQGEVLSTQDLLFKLIESNPHYPLEDLVTHEFELEAYQEAIKANLDRQGYQSIKTVFKIDS